MAATNSMVFPARQPPRLARRVAVFLGLVSLLLLMHYLGESKVPHPREQVGAKTKQVPTTDGTSKAFVVASTRAEDTSWIEEYFPDWTLIRYVVDDPEADYTVPRSKGREAMVYLTYIIDHYESLPDISVFLHSGRYQWHNDDPLYDNIPVLRSLRLSHVLKHGYTNLRCVWTLGCPGSNTNSLVALPASPSDSQSPSQAEIINHAFPSVFPQLFPNTPLPAKIGNPCCAQFAVTRSTIHLRTLAEYEHYRNWLLETDLADDLSGRVLEYCWHLIFGKPDVLCGDVKTCYCEVFGRCEIDCGDDKRTGKCDNRWHYPPWAILPKGWPEVGWGGEVRSEQELDDIKNAGLPGWKG